MSTLLALLLLASLSPFALASAPYVPPSTSHTTKGGVTATDLTLNRANSYNSTTLSRILLENKSTSPRSVSLSWEKIDGDSLVSTSVALQPSTTSLLDVPIPIENAYAHQISVKDDTGSKINLSCNYSSSLFDEFLRELYATPATKPHVLKEFDSKATSSSPKYRNSSSLDFTLSTAFTVPWPADFRAYTSFLACLLTADEFSTLPAPSQSALLDYAAAGGTLLLFQSETEPTLPFAFASSETNGIHQTSVGLGLVLTTPIASAEHLPEESLDYLHTLLIRGSRKLLRGAYELDESVTQKSEPRVTRTALVYALLVLFSILGGPVLLFRLSRRNQRLRILHYLPILSGIFCILLVISFLLANGITPHLALDAVTLLDQRAGRALTRGAITITTPLSLRRPIEIPRSSILCTQYDYKNRHTLRTRLTSTQNIHPSIVRTGIPYQVYTRSIEATHRRLEFIPSESGDTSVRNLLGATISELTVWDDNGYSYHLTDLAPGATAPLLQAPTTLSQPVSATLDPLPEKRSYYAILGSDCPFLTDPLPTTKAHRRSHAIVQGLY